MRGFRLVLPLLAGLTLTAACAGGADDSPPVSEEALEVVTPGPVVPPAPGADTAAPAAGTTGTVHEVRMVTTQGGASGEFQPATLTVRKGDVIRFINDGGAAHNANFQAPAENAGKANLPPPTPYLTTADQTADVAVTMDPGTYRYQCDPHVTTGMVGEVTVQ